MRYAIFSDIHSNLEAFISVIRAYKKESIDKYLCIGDIVDYGASPQECIELTKQLTDDIVAGNHDWACTGRFNSSYFNHNARVALKWTVDRLNLEEKDFLNKLTCVFENQDLTLVHGTLHNPKDFYYMSDSYKARMSFRLLKKNILFVGHSHNPGTFIKKGDEIRYTKDEVVKLDKKNKYIVNVGSVGQPRDGDNRACLCIFDTGHSEIRLKRITYDINTAQSKILNAGLPDFLATRLDSGN